MSRRRWYDTQIGMPLTHAASVTGRINIVASFNGSSALKIVPAIRAQAQIQLVGNGSALFAAGRFASLVANFAGASTFFGLLTGKLVPANANFSGTSTLAMIRPALIQRIVSQFAGSSAWTANLTLFGGRQSAIANFTGNSGLIVDGIIRGRIQAAANFSGVGAMITTAKLRMVAAASFTGTSAGLMSTTVRQRISAVVNFSGNSTWGMINPRLRLQAITRFAGIGNSTLMANIIPAGGGIAPAVPILTLASPFSDTTPDFNVDLPTGMGDATDVRVGDILIIQDSTDGATWNAYTSYTIAAGDLTGVNVSSTATALSPGSYQYRSRLVRGALVSAWSATVLGSVVVPPSAPSFTITSAVTDPSPAFNVFLPLDAVVGDVLVNEFSTNNGTSWSSYFTHTLISADFPIFTTSGGSLVDGSYLFRERLDRFGVPSPYSGSVPFTITTGSVVSQIMFLRTAADKGETGSGSSGGNDSFTKLLLHMDGLNNSQVFTDSSASAHTVGAGHGYRIDTTRAKFGSSSGTSVGNLDDSLFINEGSASADFAFGTGDFTIDFWFYQTGNPLGVFYDCRPLNTQGAYPAIMVHDTHVLLYFVNNTSAIFGTTPISLNAWHHAALTRSGTSTRMFLDGVQEGPIYTDTSNYLNTSVNRPFIGNDSWTASNPFIGALDEVRVSKGIARWTANFTPSVAPYSAGSATAATNLRLRSQADKGGTPPIVTTFSGIGDIAGIPTARFFYGLRAYRASVVGSAIAQLQYADTQFFDYQAQSDGGLLLTGASNSVAAHTSAHGGPPTIRALYNQTGSAAPTLINTVRANQTVFTLNAVNARPGVSLNDVNQQFLSASPLGGADTGQPLSTHIVAHQPTPGPVFLVTSSGSFFNMGTLTPTLWEFTCGVDHLVRDLSAANWHCVFGLANGVNSRLFADGAALAGVDDAGVRGLAAADTIYLGYNAFNGDYNTGGFAEWAVWNSDVSSFQAAINANVVTYYGALSGSAPQQVQVAPASLPGGMINAAYNQVITASGGTGPYTFAVIFGAIPSGLNPLTSGGVLSGIPTIVGTFNFTVRATDSLGAIGTLAYSITVVSQQPAGNTVTYQGTGFLSPTGVGPAGPFYGGAHVLQTMGFVPGVSAFTCTWVWNNYYPRTGELLRGYPDGLVNFFGTIQTPGFYGGSYSFGVGPLPTGGDIGKWPAGTLFSFATDRIEFVHVGPGSGGQDVITQSALVNGNAPCTMAAFMLRDDTATALVNGDIPLSINLASWAPFEPGLRKMNIFIGGGNTPPDQNLGELIFPFDSITRIA